MYPLAPPLKKVAGMGSLSGAPRFNRSIKSGLANDHFVYRDRESALNFDPYDAK